MRAILINPFDRSITEIDVPRGNNPLQPLYQALTGPGFPKEDESGSFPLDPAEWAGLERDEVRVDTIDIRGLGRGADIILDDEGRLKDYMACFRFRSATPQPNPPIAGRALIMGHDPQGETVGAPAFVQIGDLEKMIEWLPFDFDYEPEPMRIEIRQL